MPTPQRPALATLSESDHHLMSRVSPFDSPSKLMALCIWPRTQKPNSSIKTSDLSCYSISRLESRLASTCRNFCARLQRTFEDLLTCKIERNDGRLCHHKAFIRGTSRPRRDPQQPGSKQRRPICGIGE